MGDPGSRRGAVERIEVVRQGVRVDRPYRVITVTSNKGGVGKTTIACNLAVYLRAMREDLPILLIGFDDQPMPERMFALEGDAGGENVADAMRKGTFQDAIRLGEYGIHYVPSSPETMTLRSELRSPHELPHVLERTGWEGLVIVDTKSDLDFLTQNAISASDLSLVIVSDHASVLEAGKVFALLDEWGRPRTSARVLLSLVDLRVKYRTGDPRDVLSLLLLEVRQRGYPLIESFVSRSPKIESLYTNPEGRAHSILLGGSGSLVHRQMQHVACDVLAALHGAAYDTGARHLDGGVPRLDAGQPGEAVPVPASTPSREEWLAGDWELAAFGVGELPVITLRVRAVSPEGLRVSPLPGLALGERLHVALPKTPGEPPTLVWARVSDLDDPAATSLAFEPDEEGQVERLLRALETSRAAA